MASRVFKPIRVLSTDFPPNEGDERRNTFSKNNIAFFNCFSTEDGMKVLEILDRMTAGKVIDTNVHITIANAARRDLVDLIRMAIKQGLEEKAK